MMGIYDNKVEANRLERFKLKPFNINQLNRVMHILGQRRTRVRYIPPFQLMDIPEESLTSPLI